MKLNFNYCCYDHCDTTTNLVLETGIISSYNAKTLLSDLGDVGGCFAEDNICRNSLYTIIWSSNIFTDSCALSNSGTYKARLSGKFITVEAIQGAFRLKYLSKLCNLHNAYQTYQGVVLELLTNIISTSNDNITSETSETLNMDIPNISNTDPINAKLQFLMFKIEEFERQHFRDIWRELCKAADRYLQLIWQLLYFDPTLGARALLKRNNISATFAGEALIIWECKPITPDVIFWNYTINNSCYILLPVSVKKHILFVSPGSRDLVLSSPQIDCKDKPMGIYNDQGIWRTEQGITHVSHIPLEVTWHGK